MKTFTIIDESRVPVEFYNEDVHGYKEVDVFGPVPEPTEENPNPVAPIIGKAPNPACLIPENAIEITEAQWIEAYSNYGFRQLIQKADGKYELVQYTPPPPPELTPEEKRAAMPNLTARQLRLGLLQLGKLAGVPIAIAALPEPDKSQAQIEWDYASEFRRLHPLIMQLIPILGLTDEQVDPVWMEYSAK